MTDKTTVQSTMIAYVRAYGPASVGELAREVLTQVQGVEDGPAAVAAVKRALLHPDWHLYDNISGAWTWRKVN